MPFRLLIMVEIWLTRLRSWIRFCRSWYNWPGPMYSLSTQEHMKAKYLLNGHLLLALDLSTHGYNPINKKRCVLIWAAKSISRQITAGTRTLSWELKSYIHKFNTQAAISAVSLMREAVQIGQTKTKINKGPSVSFPQGAVTFLQTWQRFSPACSPVHKDSC